MTPRQAEHARLMRLKNAGDKLKRIQRLPNRTPVQQAYRARHIREFWEWYAAEKQPPPKEPRKIWRETPRATTLFAPAAAEPAESGSAGVSTASDITTPPPAQPAAS